MVFGLFIGYSVIVMGLQGRPWNDCHGKEKRDLRDRFDKLKATIKKKAPPAAELDRVLDKIGVLAHKAKAKK
jgi:DNA transformation protein